MIVINILGAWLFADFLSGIAHWAQDKILVPGKFQFINRAIDENILHHSKPAPWENFLIGLNLRISGATTVPVALLMYYLGLPVAIWLGIVFLSFGNFVHWLAHQRKVHPFFRVLQGIGFFSSPNHHIKHHARSGKLLKRNEARIRYCVMSNWVNPVLDSLQFFTVLEGLWAIILEKP